MNEFADAIQDETIEDSTALDAEERADTYEEAIEVKLSDSERLDKLNRLATVDAEIIRLEEEKAASAKAFGNQLKPLKAERESILGVLDSGVEKRMVECYEHFDERLGKVEVRRVDTDEVIEERAMTAQEREDAAAARQGDLFASAGSSAPPPADDGAGDGEDEDFEPDPAALAQAATDEGRIVKTNSRAARAKKAQQEQGAE